MPQADLAKPLPSNSLSVGEVLDVDAGAPSISKNPTLRTPLMLASCKKSWPFQIQSDKNQTNGKTVHACVQCKPDAPLPLAIAKHGERIIWACDATKFSKITVLCKKSLSWLGPRYSATGCSTGETCHNLKLLSKENDWAAKVYAHHHKDLKFAQKLKSETLYVQMRRNFAVRPKQGKLFLLGNTRVLVEKSVHFAEYNQWSWSIFTVISHSVRACGDNPGQPLQCLETKRSKCIESLIPAKVAFGFKSGQTLPGEIYRKIHNQACNPENTLILTTSRKLW